MNLDIEALKNLVGTAAVPQAAVELIEATRTSADDISDPALRPLWQILEECARSRKVPDAITVKTRLAGKVPSETVLDVMLDAKQGGAYQVFETLREVACRRRGMAELRAIAEAVKAGVPLAEIEHRAKGVHQFFSGSRSRVRETKGDTMKILMTAEEAWKSKQSPSLKTGWVDLDAELRLIPSLHVIGAHPGAGKSAVVAGLVRNWTQSGVKTGVLAYEDDALDMQRRIMACESGLSLAHIAGDEIPTDMEGWVRAHEVREKAEPMLVVDDDKPSGTVADALISMRRMHAMGCRVVLLDNMSCVRLDNDDARHEELERALLAFREAALELRLPVIVIGHLKRGMSDGDEITRRPKLTDFAGAAAWERVSRSACGMWRDGESVCLKVLKQTNGKCGGEFWVDMAQRAATVTSMRFRQPDEKTARRY